MRLHIRIRRYLAVSVLLSGISAQSQTSRNEAAAHVGKGYALVQNDQFAEAASEFRAALAVEPDAVQIRYQLAVCLFALGEREESRREFVRVQATTQQDPKVVYYLARLDLLAGDPGSAIPRLESIMLDPPFPDAAFYLGSAYLEKRDTGKAIDWLRKATESDPRDFRSHYRLARALAQTGRHKQAEEEYTASTELRERYNETGRQSLTCATALREQTIEQARDVCGRLFDRSDPDKLTTLGIVYGENGKYEEAIEPLKRATELDPDSFEILHNLGLSYFRLKRFSDARVPLERAVQLRPNFFGSNALLGAVLYSLKDDEAAYHTLDLAHKLNPEDGDTSELLFRVSMILGKRFAAAGEYESSLKFLEKAAGLRPGTPDLQRHIAEIKNQIEKQR